MLSYHCVCEVAVPFCSSDRRGIADFAMEPLLGAADGSEGGGGMPDGRGGVRRRGEARIDAAGAEQHDTDAAPRRRARVVAVIAGLAVAALCALGWSAAVGLVNPDVEASIRSHAATVVALQDQGTQVSATGTGLAQLTVTSELDNCRYGYSDDCTDCDCGQTVVSRPLQTS